MEQVDDDSAIDLSDFLGIFYSDLVLSGFSFEELGVLGLCFAAPYLPDDIKDQLDSNEVCNKILQKLVSCRLLRFNGETGNWSVNINFPSREDTNE